MCVVQIKICDGKRAVSLNLRHNIQITPFSQCKTGPCGDGRHIIGACDCYGNLLHSRGRSLVCIWAVGALIVDGDVINHDQLFAYGKEIGDRVTQRKAPVDLAGIGPVDRGAEGRIKCRIKANWRCARSCACAIFPRCGTAGLRDRMNVRQVHINNVQRARSGQITLNCLGCFGNTSSGTARTKRNFWLVVCTGDSDGNYISVACITIVGSNSERQNGAFTSCKEIKCLCSAIKGPCSGLPGIARPCCQRAIRRDGQHRLQRSRVHIIAARCSRR